MKGLKYLQWVNHVLGTGGLIAACYYQWWGWLYASLAAYVVLGFFGITIGYHRLIAHRSFQTSKPIEYVLACIGGLCTLTSPLGNALLHRTHHRYSDTEHDFHSPHTNGWLRAWFGDWMTQDIKLHPRLIKDLYKDPFYQFTHQHYVTLLWLVVIGLTLIDWKWTVFLYCLPATLLFHVKGLFNTFGHTWGYRNYDTPDQSRNSWLVNILTLGDGWHNNHHAQPHRWDQGDHWWEVDFAAWFIRLIKKDRLDDLTKTQH